MVRADLVRNDARRWSLLGHSREQAGITQMLWKRGMVTFVRVLAQAIDLLTAFIVKQVQFPRLVFAECHQLQRSMGQYLMPRHALTVMAQSPNRARLKIAI